MKLFNLGINILFFFYLKLLVGSHFYISINQFPSEIPSSSGTSQWNLDSSSAKIELWVSHQKGSEQQSPEPLSSSLSLVCWREPERNGPLLLNGSIPGDFFPNLTYYWNTSQSKLKQQVYDFRDLTSTTQSQDLGPASISDDLYNWKCVCREHTLSL